MSIVPLRASLLLWFVAGTLLLPLHHAWIQNNPASKVIVQLPSKATRRFPSSPNFMARGDPAPPEDEEDSTTPRNPPRDNSPITESSDTHDHKLEGSTNTNADRLHKRIRLAKAQAEIDRILKNPVDPHFDVETEMKKVTNISPPLVAEGSTEYEVEQKISQMEQDLYTAVKAQDFTTATQKQSEISQLHVDDCGLVLQVNSAFYKAFSNKDVAEMERIWLKDRSCICIHPSFKPLSGVRDIISTWKRMFESSSGSFQRTWIDPWDIQLTVKATTAIVTCEEHVYARRFVRGKKRESELVNKLMATNIFRKVGGKWYMTYHHSSWHADSEAAKMALKRGNSGTAKLARKTPPKDRQSSRKPPDDEDKDNEPTGLESILGLGNTGPILGDESNGKAAGRSKKIILGGSGSLSDMMMNLLNQKDDITGDSDADENDSGPSGAIIHFSRIDDEEDDEEEDDDDDEEEGETFEIFDAETNDDDDDSFSDLQSWVIRARSPRRNRKWKQQSQSTDLRQECIDSLRKLSNKGRISPKQKRVLLTDIIRCSAQGKSSMVEVAFELLCEGKDPEEFEEEFVDQCQVFAQSLSETP
jgi:hypothetical protein